MSGFKNVLVTGASSEIGSAIAKDLAKDSSIRLILHGSNMTPAASIIKLLGSSKVHHYVSCDFRESTNIKSAFQSAVEAYPVSGWVNAVGVRSRRPLRAISHDHLVEIFQLNFFSFVELAKLVTRKNCFAPPLSIVQISSVSSLLGGKGIAAYAASKAATDNAVKSIAKELFDKQIRLNSISCGQVQTKAFNKLIQQTDDESRIGDRQFFGTIMVSSVVELTKFLLSSGSSQITGQIIPLDGGYLL